MSAILSVKYKIILLVVSTALLLSGVNLYIIRSYHQPLQQYDTMIGNIAMANSLLIATREIVDKDFYSTLSNLKDTTQKSAFTNKLRSLQDDIKELDDGLLSDDEATSLKLISRMTETFVQVCMNILDEYVPMKDKLDDYERAATIQLLLNKNMGDFISLQIQNRNKVAEGLDYTTRRLLVVSIATLIIILILCIVWGSLYANRIAESIYQEMSIRKESEKLAQHQANHDTLTKLPNRRLFEQFTNSLMMTHPDRPKALMFIDLDGFKTVNDKYGHDVGDELLVQYAGIFKACVREVDMVSRFGGDEFIIAIAHSNRKLVEKIVNRIISETRKPIVINNLTLNTTVSIGISFYPGSGKTLDELIVAADIAMYLAKNGGKNKYIFASDLGSSHLSGES